MKINNSTTVAERIEILKQNRDLIISEIKEILSIQNQKELKEGMKILFDIITDSFYDYTTADGLETKDVLNKVSEDFNPSGSVSNLTKENNRLSDIHTENQKKLMRVSL